MDYFKYSLADTVSVDGQVGEIIGCKTTRTGPEYEVLLENDKKIVCAESILRRMEFLLETGFGTI